MNLTVKGKLNGHVLCYFGTNDSWLILGHQFVGNEVNMKIKMVQTEFELATHQPELVSTTINQS